MLKATDGKTIILGLERGNIERLKAGDPIEIKGEEVGANRNILIVYGDTVVDIAHDLGLEIPTEAIEALNKGGRYDGEQRTPKKRP